MPVVVLNEGDMHRKTADYLPATSLGVLIHSATGVLISLGYVISAWL